MSASLGVIRNAAGERLDVAYHPPAGTTGTAGPDALVILAHGVTAHKDRPLLIALAEACSAAGLASLRISYAGNGESEGRFVDSVPSKEVEDLGAVIDAVEQWGVARIGYAGHSMGGAVGVLRTSRDARIRCLAVLAEQPNNRVALGTIRDLLADADVPVRIAAYDAYCRCFSFLSTKVGEGEAEKWMGDFHRTFAYGADQDPKYAVDVVPVGAPLVLMSVSGQPRVTVFGPTPGSLPSSSIRS